MQVSVQVYTRFSEDEFVVNYSSKQVILYVMSVCGVTDCHVHVLRHFFYISG